MPVNIRGCPATLGAGWFTGRVWLKKPTWPQVALVGFILVWGMNFVVLRYALVYFSPKATMLVRFVLMLPALMAATKLLKQTAHVPRDQLLKHWFAGFLHSGVYMILFVEGMDHLAPAQGAVTLVTSPVWIGLFSIIAGQERFRWGLLAGMAVAYAGVAMTLLGGSGKGDWTVLGVALVGGSAVVWAFSVTLMKKLLDGRPPLGVFTATLPGAVFALVPYALIDTLRTNYASVSFTGWAAMAYLAFLAGAAAFTAYYVALGAIGPARVALGQYFVPVVASIGGWAVMGKALNFVQVLGIGTVLAGVAVANIGRGKNAEADSAVVSVTGD